METVYLKLFKRFFLFAAFTCAVSGCGSSSSTANNGTGSIAASLTWSSPKPVAAKTLYAAPAGVANIQIIVSAADMQDTVSGSFPAAAGTGRLDGIPAGTGRIVKINGLDSGGNIRYKAEVSGVLIEPGKITDLGTITMQPVPSTTSASPAGGTYLSAQSVTLTASDPATIYYTTNGDTPTTNSNSGPSPVQNIQVSSYTLLQFFSINALNAQETLRTEEYFITP